MKSDTVQSELIYHRDTVLKTYKRSHPFFDEKYFRSEIESLSKLKDNKYFTQLLLFNLESVCYTMERYDFSLGGANYFTNSHLNRLFFTLTLDEIQSNLYSILNSLKEHGLTHRDINPGNLLFSESERVIKLSDFFWSHNPTFNLSLPEPNKQHPWPVNHIYGNDDEIAIDLLLDGMKKYYQMVYRPGLMAASDAFITTAGAYGYRDGSGVHRGYAYHIVDVPLLRARIACHKRTCKEEYSTIKKQMPLEYVESFIDIGAANGYFSFNLLRDHTIRKGFMYEADPFSAKLLRDIKLNCWLHELDIFGGINDTYDFPPVDLAIFLNSHMWFYKQIGKERTLNFVSNVLENCRFMFFQTCGAYSSGMYKVEEYKTPGDIEFMLYFAGAKEVRHVAEFIGNHDAPRDMFLAKGAIE